VARPTLGAFVKARARLGTVAKGEHLEEREPGEDGGESDHDDMIDLCALQR
jgi:hypothetical protein